MHLGFYDSHIETLNKLQELANKHNSVIRFGVRPNVQMEDINLFDGLIEDDILKLIGEFDYEIIDGDTLKNDSTLWFELYEKEREDLPYGRYHVMSYEKNSTWVSLKYHWKENLEDIDNENSKKLLDWLNENLESEYALSIENEPTIIEGFGNKEKIVDYRIYREGMALHFFAELVCKYFNEPMIHNTY